MHNSRQLITPYPAGGPVSISYNFPPGSCHHCHILLRETTALKEKVAAIEQKPSEVNKEDFTKFRNAIENRSRAFEKHSLGHIITFSKLIEGHIKNLMKERESLNSGAGEKDLRSLNETLDEIFKAVEAMEQMVQGIAAGRNGEREIDR